MAIDTAVVNILIKARNKTEGVFKKILASAKSLQGTLAAIGATAFLTDAVQTAGSFETSIRKVVVAAGNAVDRFDDIKKAAADAGATTAFSATDAARALEILIKTGFSVDEAIGTLPTTLNFATANSLDLADAVEIAAKTMNNMGLNTGDTTEKVHQFNRVGNVLTKNVNAAAQSMPELGRAFSQTGASAGQLNLGLEETASIISFLAKEGLNLEQRSTGLKNLFAQIANSASPAQKALRAAGIATSDFYEVIDELRSLGAEATPVIAAFGLEAGPALQKLVGAGTEGLREFQDSVRSTGNELEEARAIMSGGFKGAVDGLNSSWEALKIVFGDEFLTDVVNSLRDLTDRIRILAAGGDLDLLKDAVSLVITVLQELGRVAGIAFDALSVAGNAVKGVFNVLTLDIDEATSAFSNMGTTASRMGTNIKTGLIRLIGSTEDYEKRLRDVEKAQKAAGEAGLKSGADQEKSIESRAEKQERLTEAQQIYLGAIDRLTSKAAVFKALGEDTEAAKLNQEALNNVTAEYGKFLEENKTLIEDTNKAQADSAKAVAEALNGLGVTSEELAKKQIEAGQAQFKLLKEQSTLIKSDNIVSVKELERAWLAMAEESLKAANNADASTRTMATNTLEQQAAVLGLSDEYQALSIEILETGKTQNRLRDLGITTAKELAGEVNKLKSAYAELSSSTESSRSDIVSVFLDEAAALREQFQFAEETQKRAIEATIQGKAAILGVTEEIERGSIAYLSYEERVTAAKKALSDLSDNVTTLRSAEEEQQRILQNTKLEYDAIRQVLVDLRNDSTATAEELTEVAEKVEKAEARYNKELDKSKTVRNQLAAAEAQLVAAKENVAKATEKENTFAAERIAAAERELREVEQLNEIKATEAQVRQQIADLVGTEADKVRAAADVRREEIEGLKRLLEAKEQDKEAAEARLQALEEESEKSAQKKEELREEVEAQRAVVDEKRHEITVTGNLIEAKKEEARVRDELAAAAKKEAETKARSDAAQGEITAIERINELKQIEGDHRQRLAEIIEDEEQKVREARRARDAEIQGMKNLLAAKRNDLEVAQARLTSLELEAGKSAERAAALKDEIEAQKTVIAEKEHEVTVAAKTVQAKEKEAQASDKVAKKKLEEAKANAKAAAEAKKAEQAAKRSAAAASFIDAVNNGIASRLGKLSTESKKAWLNYLSGGKRAAEQSKSLNELLRESVIKMNNLNTAVLKWRGTLSGWAYEQVQAGERIAQAYFKQAIEAEKITKTLDGLTENTRLTTAQIQQLQRETRVNLDQFKLLDEERLGKLRGALDSAKNKLQEIRNKALEAKEALSEMSDDFLNELDQLRGNEEAVLDREFKKRREQLREYHEESNGLAGAEYAEAESRLAALHAEKMRQLREERAEEAANNAKNFEDEIRNITKGNKQREGGIQRTGGALKNLNDETLKGNNIILDSLNQRAGIQEGIYNSAKIDQQELLALVQKEIQLRGGSLDGLQNQLQGLLASQSGLVGGANQLNSIYGRVNGNLARLTGQANLFGQNMLNAANNISGIGLQQSQLFGRQNAQLQQVHNLARALANKIHSERMRQAQRLTAFRRKNLKAEYQQEISNVTNLRDQYRNELDNLTLSQGEQLQKEHETKLSNLREAHKAAGGFATREYHQARRDLNRIHNLKMSQIAEEEAAKQRDAFNAHSEAVAEFNAKQQNRTAELEHEKQLAELQDARNAKLVSDLQEQRRIRNGILDDENAEELSLVDRTRTTAKVSNTQPVPQQPGTSAPNQATPQIPNLGQFSIVDPNTNEPIDLFGEADQVQRLLGLIGASQVNSNQV